MIKTKVNFDVKKENCRCGSIFSHWKKFGHQDIRGCPVIGCKKVDLLGTFVEKANSTDKNSYVIPLCSEHATSKEV